METKLDFDMGMPPMTMEMTIKGGRVKNDAPRKEAPKVAEAAGGQ